MKRAWHRRLLVHNAIRRFSPTNRLYRNQQLAGVALIDVEDHRLIQRLRRRASARLRLEPTGEELCVVPRYVVFNAGRAVSVVIARQETTHKLFDSPQQSSRSIPNFQGGSICSISYSIATRPWFGINRHRFSKPAFATCSIVGKWAVLRGTLRRKLADFARLRDETVPTAFDQYWDHPTFVTYNYFLTRVGAEPELPKGRLKSRSRGARLPEEVASAVRGRVPPRFKL